MDNRSRFHAVMNFESADRLPLVEWAGWWDKTIDRWKEEGLPSELEDAGEIREYLGLDRYMQCWIRPDKPDFPTPERHGQGVVSNMDDYLCIKKYLFPENPFDKEMVRRWADEQARGETVVWITLEGFFWFPRKLFGIEEHLYAFYDNPEVMHAMNRDLLAYNLRVLDEFCELCIPDFMTFAEDMSYNNGPMISAELFEEFMAPYYVRIVLELKKFGVIPLVDSDGDIEGIVPWFGGVGVEGFLPLERQAGVDIGDLRRQFPQLRIIGGYDKMVMSKGEEAMRAEFERILPVMKLGGFIPSVDHQTPPAVSLYDYGTYLKLLKEYCVKAMQ